MSSTEHHRHIRTFVRREGRLTQSQERALSELWPRYGLELSDGELNYTKTFGRSGKTFLEIGFGNGASLASMAANAPENNYIGIEVHRPGVGHLLLDIEDRELENIRIYKTDGLDILKEAIPDNSLDGVFLFFADPWPKKKHHKRRMYQHNFLNLIHQKLLPGGFLHSATDWEPYAEHMLEIARERSDYEFPTSYRSFSPKPDYRPETKFERRGLKLGHKVNDLIIHKI